MGMGNCAAEEELRKVRIQQEEAERHSHEVEAQLEAERLQARREREKREREKKNLEEASTVRLLGFWHLSFFRMIP